MGRGDIKSKKGKIFAGSFGKKRPAKPAKKIVVTAEVVEVETKKKTAKKKA
jgi:30S ribosomal protein S31